MEHVLNNSPKSLVINYDKHGTPTTVMLKYEDYTALLEILNKNTENNHVCPEPAGGNP